jgi:P4 family phage/plasmid primase-like protien
MSTVTLGTDGKPLTVRVSADTIPGELKLGQHHVVWRWELRKRKDGTSKWTKPPLRPNGSLASTTDSATWCTFGEAWKAYRGGGFDGVGRVLNGDGLVGVDLDDVRDSATGKIAETASTYVDLLKSYAEVTPTGCGLRGFVKAHLERAHNKNGIEVYATGRYLTLTGFHLPGTPSTIESRQAELEEFCRQAFPSERVQAGGAEPQDDDKGDAAPPNIAEIEAALAYINADERDLWFRIGAALHKGLGAQGRSPWDAWSRKSTKFDEADQEATWKGFKANGDAGLGTLFELAKQGGWSREPNGGKKRRKHWYAAAVAAAIKTQGDHYAQDAGGKLYVYRNGVYIPEGIEHVRRRTKKLVSPTSEWSTHLANETAEYLRADAALLWETPPCDVLNVSNGLLEVEGRALNPHSPDFLTSIQLPVRYVPEATCPAWEKQIEETFPPDAVKAGVAFQIVAFLMIAYTALQKALLLLGGGGTGKSTFLTAIIYFLGRRNVASVPMQKLESDRFAASRLVGKLANIFADLPSSHLESSAMFKSITGGDPIPAEYKFKDSFDFVPFARPVFSANQAPVSEDATDAFFQRWTVIPFNNVYRGTAQEISRVDLDARLSTPSELSGVLNRALDALPAVLKNGVTVAPSMRAAFEEFWKNTDPLAIWLAQNTVDDPAAFVSCNRLITDYNAILAADSRPILTQKAFGTALRKLRPKVDTSQRRVGANSKVWCYIGIGLKVAKGYSEEDQL